MAYTIQRMKNEDARYGQLEVLRVVVRRIRYDHQLPSQQYHLVFNKKSNILSVLMSLSKNFQFCLLCNSIK